MKIKKELIIKVSFIFVIFFVVSFFLYRYISDNSKRSKATNPSNVVISISPNSGSFSRETAQTIDIQFNNTINGKISGVDFILYYNSDVFAYGTNSQITPNGPVARPDAIYDVVTNTSENYIKKIRIAKVLKTPEPPNQIKITLPLQVKSNAPLGQIDNALVFKVGESTVVGSTIDRTPLEYQLPSSDISKSYTIVQGNSSSSSSSVSSSSSSSIASSSSSSSGLPDLTSEIVFSPPNNIGIGIRNIGSVPARDINFYGYINITQPPDSTTIPAFSRTLNTQLLPGTDYIYSRSYDPGTYTVYGWVDKDNTIIESNENNNKSGPRTIIITDISSSSSSSSSSFSSSSSSSSAISSSSSSSSRSSSSSSSRAACEKTKGDANCDEVIDSIDYAIWLDEYNKHCTSTGNSATCSLDMDHDGVSMDADFNLSNAVTILDYNNWLANFTPGQ